MSLKEKYEKEYDEDLEELLGEEYSEEDDTDDEEEVEVEDTEYQENKLVTLLPDTDIEKNISSFLVWGTVIKWLMIIVGVIMFIVCIASEAGALAGIFMLITFIVYGFLSSMLLKWFGYVLKCLHDIKNK